MKTQEKYWDQKIKNWTQGAYRGKFTGLDLVERLANLFRGPISGRLKATLKIIGPLAKNKVVLDLGCGLGDFCFELLSYQPRKVIGIDISGAAIKMARQLAKKKKVNKQVKFIQTDLGQTKKLPDFDLAVGLGFIDYLNKEELARLFKLLGQKKFLFSFFEKKLTLRNLLHEVYIRLKKCPGAFKYSRTEIRQLAPKELGLKFWEKEKLLFITNLPE